MFGVKKGIFWKISETDGHKYALQIRFSLIKQISNLFSVYVKRTSVIIKICYFDFEFFNGYVSSFMGSIWYYYAVIWQIVFHCAVQTLLSGRKTSQIIILFAYVEDFCIIFRY